MANVVIVISLFLFGIGLVALNDAKKGYQKNIRVVGRVTRVRSHQFSDEEARSKNFSEELFDTTYEYEVKGRTYKYTEKNRDDQLQIGQDVALYCNESNPEIVFIVHTLINGFERNPLDDTSLRKAAQNYLFGGIGMVVAAIVLFVFSFRLK